MPRTLLKLRNLEKVASSFARFQEARVCPVISESSKIKCSKSILSQLLSLTRCSYHEHNYSAPCHGFQHPPMPLSCRSRLISCTVKSPIPVLCKRKCLQTCATLISTIVSAVVSSLLLVVVRHLQTGSLESALDVEALVRLGAVQDGLVAADML